MSTLRVITLSPTINNEVWLRRLVAKKHINGCYYICVHVTKGGDPKNSEMRAEMKPDPDSLGAQLRVRIISIKGNCAQALNDDPS